MPETFHTPDALVPGKSLVPSTSPGQAALLHRMQAGLSTRFRLSRIYPRFCARARGPQRGRWGWLSVFLLSTAVGSGPVVSGSVVSGPVVSGSVGLSLGLGAVGWGAVGTIGLVSVLPRTAAAQPRPNAIDSATRLDPVVRHPQARYARATVVHSLEEAFVGATDHRLGPPLAQVVKRVIVWWMNPRRDLRKGDVFEAIFEERPDEEPLLLAVWMTSQKTGKRSAVRYRAADADFFRYYTRDGREVERRLRRSPVRNYEQITSLIDDGRGHRGVDFKAPEGTPVVAPFNGVVLRRNWSTRRNGRCLEIINPKNGHRAIFLHLKYIYRRIRRGVRVRAGQRIAALGNTGRSSAPHLHYQLETRSGRLLDPLRVHRTWRAKLKPAETEEMVRVFDRLDQMRTGSK